MYETPDNVDQQTTSDYYEEEPENEYIERMHLSAPEAYQRFQGSRLEGEVDFSERIVSSRRARRGYIASSLGGTFGDYELEAMGMKETPIQKCRRLQSEMNELLDEITTLQNDRKVLQEEKDSYEAVSKEISNAKQLLDSLRLEQVLGKEETGPQMKEEVKNLVKQVEDYKKMGILPSADAAKTLGNGVDNFAGNSRVAKLEHRLYQLEQAVGAKPDKMMRLSNLTNNTNIMDAVRQLSMKAVLLQSEKVEAIELRLVALTTKMDALAQKSDGMIKDAAQEQKLLDLYEIAKKTEVVADILPDIIDRMQALEALHKYGKENITKVRSF